MFVLELLKNPRTIVTFVFALLALAILRFGADIGLKGSLQWVVLIFIGVLFVMVQLMIGMMGKKKEASSDDGEDSMVIEADSPAKSVPAEDKKAGRAARDELLEVIEILKNSKSVGGQAGSAALPWYLVMGPEVSGKSTLISNSGLQLPGAGNEQFAGITKAVNCGWWFTNQAVILESNWGYLVSDPDADSNWNMFLEQLHKVRPGIPLNGIILTVPADSLLQWDQCRLAELANQLRKRLDTADDKLQAHIPVYVIVTKTDQVNGFKEFFADLDTAPRNQVFGCTIDASKMQSNDPGELFRREFDQLYGSVYQRRIPLMVRERNLDIGARAFTFPLEFKRLRDQLGYFINCLYQPNPLASVPLFRGFYFTSGTGPVANPKPHFLKGFFLRSLIPDFQLARPTVARVSRQNLKRTILRGLGFALLGAMGLLLVISFSRNLSLVSSTRELAESATYVVATRADVHGLEEALVLLDRLRLRLENLDETDKFHSPALGLGLYRGERINVRAREIYIDRLVTVLLAPSRQKLETQLLRDNPTSAAENQAFEASYRAYRMLVDPDNGIPDFLSVEISDLWSEHGTNRAATPRLLGLIDSHIRYAWTHFEDIRLRSTVLPGLNRDLTLRASKFIRESWKPERYFDTTIAEINTRTKSYSLADVYNSTDVLTSEVDSIPGAYTIEGWRSDVRTQIESSDQTLREDWILRDVFQDQDVTIKGWLVRKYAENYIDVWSKFLGSIDLVPTGSVKVAGQQVWDLAGQDSPFVRLLEDARTNLQFESGDFNDDSEDMAPLLRIEESFGALHSLFEKKDDAKPIDKILADLEKVAGEMDSLQDADDLPAAAAEFSLAVFKSPSKDPSAIHGSLITIRHHSNRTPDGSQTACTDAVRAYLERPAKAAWRSCLTETGTYLNRRWGEVVYGTFKNTLKGRYPLAGSGSDASLDDYTNFFGPTGVLWKFVNAELAPYTKTNWQAAIIYGYGLPLNRDARSALGKADLIKRALYSGDAEKPSVKFSLEAMQVPSPSGTNYIITQSMLWLGNKRLRYDMGRSRTMDFTWPGEQESIAGRVGVALEGRSPEPIDIDPSTWTIFRLLDLAKSEKVDARNYRLTWTLKRTGEYELEVPFKLRANTSTNPFAPGFLKFRCPQKLTAN